MRAYEIALFTILVLMVLGYYQDVLNPAVKYNTGVLGSKSSEGVPTIVGDNILKPSDQSPILAALETAYGLFSYMLSFLWILFKAVFLVPWILLEVGLPVDFVAIISTGIYVIYGVAAFQIWTSRNVSMSE